MLARKLCSIYQKRTCLFMSTLPLPKPDVIQSVDSKSNANAEKKPASIYDVPDYFSVASLFTVKDLFNAKVHYGHKDTSVHPKMAKFIFGSRLGHTIFDLDITAFHLKEALNFAAHIAYIDGIILFISKNPRATLLVEDTALECKEFAVTREWALGAFTGAENRFGSVTRLPDLCIILNTLLENGHEHMAVVEAAKMCIPTIGVVDSNCDPSLITFPIPGNDDSFSSVQLYCKLFKQAILKGKSEKKKYLEFLKSQEKYMNENNDSINKKVS